MTPYVLILISVFIGLLNTEIKPIWKSVLLAGLIILNDIGLKLFSGGSHDSEGLGWIHMMLFIGLIPAFGLLIAGVFKTKKGVLRNKWIAILVFPILIWIHLLLFSDLGLGRYY